MNEVTRGKIDRAAGGVLGIALSIPTFNAYWLEGWSGSARLLLSLAVLFAALLGAFWLSRRFP